MWKPPEISLDCNHFTQEQNTLISCSGSDRSTVKWSFLLSRTIFTFLSLLLRCLLAQDWIIQLKFLVFSCKCTVAVCTFFYNLFEKSKYKMLTVLILYNVRCRGYLLEQAVLIDMKVQWSFWKTRPLYLNSSGIIWNISNK